jgi:hypothetical protein
MGKLEKDRRRQIPLLPMLVMLIYQTSPRCYYMVRTVKSKKAKSKNKKAKSKKAATTTAKNDPKPTSNAKTAESVYIFFVCL